MDSPSSRALVLLSLLQTQRAWTASELARHLDIAERTVRRDISRLRSPGYDIRSTPGPGGTYRLVPSIKIPPLLLDADEWLSPGTHLDLIGAYRPDMREVDDETLRRARLFVDSRATTLGHIGEIQIPLDQGVITSNDVLADFYDLPAGAYARQSDDEITVAKNGGGAHLDLMTAKYIQSVADA